MLVRVAVRAGTVQCRTAGAGCTAEKSWRTARQQESVRPGYYSAAAIAARREAAALQEKANAVLIEAIHARFEIDGRCAGDCYGQMKLSDAPSLKPRKFRGLL